MKKHIMLPNDCYCTRLKVIPKNWKDPDAPTDRPWIIYYNFFEPGHKAFSVQLRGMNGTKNIEIRQRLTRTIGRDELTKLKINGYNPRTQQLASLPVGRMPGETLLMPALRKALQGLSVSKTSIDSISSQLNRMEFVAPAVSVKSLNVGYIKTWLAACQQKYNWSPSTYNTYRARLRMLLVELKDLGAIKDIDSLLPRKQKQVKKIKRLLTADERVKVAAALQAYPEFWRFVNIFYHSGGRTPELLRLKTEDVDLKKQRYTTTILKDKNPYQTNKVVKDIALPYWQEAMAQANPGEYVFGPWFKPGRTRMHTRGPGQAWDRIVRDRLGIDVTFYALKFMHTTEVAELLGSEAAAIHNSHKSTAMVRKIYDVNAGDREMDQLKKLNNSFS